MLQKILSLKLYQINIQLIILIPLALINYIHNLISVEWKKYRFFVGFFLSTVYCFTYYDY